MSFIDSHCHLNSELYKELSLSEILNDAKKNNINKFLSIAVDYNSTKENLKIKDSFTQVLITIGLHPNYITKNYELDLKKILQLFDKNKFAAIGEIGLDYAKNYSFKKEQIIAFERQIALSIQNKKPIVIHTRDSFDDTYSIIKSSNYNKFIIHCFAGDKYQVKKYLDLNCYISFSGIITIKKSLEICEAAKYVPLTKLLIETDSPYLSPNPLRGKLNFPKNLILIAKRLAELKNVDLSEIENKTTNNFNEIFQ